MRIVSGSSTESIYFVAFSTADHITRVTGHTTAGFSVFFSKANTTGTTAAVAFTEINSTQCPGLYSLSLLDSTLTALPAGIDSRELAITISGSMDIITRTVELYRRTVTTGETLSAAMLTSVNAKVTSVDSRLTSMDTMLSSVNAKVTSIDTDVDTVITKVTSIDSRLTSMDTMLTSVNAKVTSVDSRLTSMDTMLSSVNAKVTSVDTDIDTALTRLSSLGTHVDTILTRTSPNNIGAAVWDAQTTAYRALGSFGQIHYVEHRGNAVAFTTNTVTLDSSASTVDGTYSNSVIVVGTSADGVGQARTVTDHTSLVLTVSGQWSPANPSTPISFYIVPQAPVAPSTAAVALTTSDHEAIAAAVWDEQTSSHATAGTFGLSVASNLTKVTSIDSRLSSMDTMLSSVNSKVTSVDSRLTSMDTMLSSVNAKVTSVDTKVSSMNTQVTSILANVTSIDSRLTSMDTMLTSVNAKASSADANIALTLTKLTSVETDVDALIVIATSIDSKVTAIQAQTTQFVFTQPGVVDSNIHYVNSVQVQGTGSTADTWRPV
jgi:peptidoglycan hydrolase CwlO-like protein